MHVPVHADCMFITSMYTFMHLYVCSTLALTQSAASNGIFPCVISLLLNHILICVCVLCILCREDEMKKVTCLHLTLTVIQWSLVKHSTLEGILNATSPLKVPFPISSVSLNTYPIVATLVHTSYHAEVMKPHTEIHKCLYYQLITHSVNLFNHSRLCQKVL